jgi:hypothetical protein
MGGRMKWVGSKEMDRDFEARGKDISKTILLFSKCTHFMKIRTRSPSGNVDEYI